MCCGEAVDVGHERWCELHWRGELGGSLPGGDGVPESLMSLVLGALFFLLSSFRWCALNRRELGELGAAYVAWLSESSESSTSLEVVFASR